MQLRRNRFPEPEHGSVLRSGYKCAGRRCVSFVWSETLPLYHIPLPWLLLLVRTFFSRRMHPELTTCPLLVKNSFILIKDSWPGSVGRCGGSTERERDIAGQPLVPQTYGEFVKAARFIPLTRNFTPEQPMISVTRDATIGTQRVFAFRIQGFVADLNIAPMGDHLQYVQRSSFLADFTCDRSFTLTSFLRNIRSDGESLQFVKLCAGYPIFSEQFVAQREAIGNMIKWAFKSFGLTPPPASPEHDKVLCFRRRVFENVSLSIFRDEQQTEQPTICHRRSFHPPLIILWPKSPGS